MTLEKKKRIRHVRIETRQWNTIKCSVYETIGANNEVFVQSISYVFFFNTQKKMQQITML